MVGDAAGLAVSPLGAGVGAGAGTANRLSPRAAVALLGALMDELARHGDDLTAAIPVSGVDPGNRPRTGEFCACPVKAHAKSFERCFETGPDAKELGLANDRVWIYNQKKNQPTDEKMFVVVSVLTCKPFANTSKFLPDGTTVQSINMMATLSLNVKSRSTEALLRKEEVLMALASHYAQSQQEQNSFLIGKLPPGAQFVNLSEVDGAAIPYRFNISVNMQYFVKKVKAVPYLDQFDEPEVTTEP